MSAVSLTCWLNKPVEIGISVHFLTSARTTCAAGRVAVNFIFHSLQERFYFLFLFLFFYQAENLRTEGGQCHVR